MVYTLSQGAQRPNSKLHYSLYGGVEELPDRSRAAKELLVAAVPPAVAIAFLLAILNFHIPVLSPRTGSGGGETVRGQSAAAHSIVLRPSPHTSSAGSTNNRSTATNTTNTSSSSSMLPSVSGPSTPVVTDAGQGIGGLGGGGGTTPPSTSDTKSVINNLVQPGATVTTTGTSTTVSGSVTSPAAGTTVTVPPTTIDP